MSIAAGGSVSGGSGYIGKVTGSTGTVTVSTMRFVGGSVPFTIEGVPIAQDAALVGAGLSYALSDRPASR